jgi:hypothetical protein
MGTDDTTGRRAADDWRGAADDRHRAADDRHRAADDGRREAQDGRSAVASGRPGSTVRRSAALLVVGVLLIGAVGRAPLTSVGPLVAELRADLGLTSAATGLLTTLPLLAFALFSLVAPRIAGRIGL